MPEQPGSDNESLAKPRDTRELSNTAILIICMGIAFLLWLLIKLSNTYSGQVTAYVHYSNLPENKVLVKPLEKKVKLRVETTGFKLLLSNVGFQPVNIDIDFQELHNTHFILTEDVKKRISENLPPDIKLHSISPDTLYLYFDEKATKKVPVRLDADLEFEKQFGLKKSVQLSPETILVAGPRVLLDSIHEWKTAVLKRKQIKGDLRGTIGLATPGKEGLSVTPDKVHYNLNVEEFTEHSLEVPVTRINVPAGISITTYPKNIKVTFQVALSNFEAVNAAGFELVADFSKIDLHNQKQVYLQLVKYPPYLKNVTFSPQSVEYIIYK